MSFDDDDQPISRPTAAPLAEVLASRLSRRGALAGMAAGALAGMTAMGALAALPRVALAAGPNPSSFKFRQPSHTVEDDHAVADGYRADVLIRWGDPVLPGAPAFDPMKLSAEAQAMQFGYNNDFVAFLPLPGAQSARGLLCVNHEYTNAELMWPDVKGGSDPAMTPERARVEMAAHGHSVIEIERTGGAWRVVPNSPYARRITLLATEMDIAGPAAGDDRLKTKADPDGRRIVGTLNNCAGGVTPWGTVLIAEENFHLYFAGDPKGTSEAANHKRLGIKGRPFHNWAAADERFDVETHPHEPNRFGWMVEIDPFDPTSTPVKRTALGRFKHEGAGAALAKDGRAVVYMGDDQAFEYLYKFVSRDPLPATGQAGLKQGGILDHGTLYVARFSDNGGVDWLPLQWGRGSLTAANGFHSQADVLIEARRAGDLVGATPLDRPEDVEVNPVNGRVYAMLTNNKDRTADRRDKVNPRGPNLYGHIVEIIPGDGDHGLEKATWQILLKAGDPAAGVEAEYHPDTQTHGAWLAAPDNAAVDPQGRLWISTDQGSGQRKTKIPDGMYACDLEGDGRALTRLFYRCPRDAEMCGPAFTPDGKTLFVAVQHPGEGKGSTFATPSTRWPDFKPDMPPRPAIVAITKSDGGVVGS